MELVPNNKAHEVKAQVTDWDMQSSSTNKQQFKFTLMSAFGTPGRSMMYLYSVEDSLMSTGKNR